jgi:DNA modification methylase
VIHVGDCLEWLRTLPDCSVDSCVTDPPYGLGREPDPREVLAAWLSGDAYQPGGRGFMGKAWDSFVPSPVVWAEVFRVLKPGGHLLAFAGSRTYDWIALGVRLAGFEIRDQLMWLYGSGFPKSHDVSKAIDRAAGAEREIVGHDAGKAKQQTASIGPAGYGGNGNTGNITAPATEAAQRWQGWGTALKPAHEPIVMARKPLIGTVADNVQAHGTGAINVDGCRVDGAYQTRDRDTNGGASMFGTGAGGGAYIDAKGRWPANVMHDGSAEVVAGFPVARSAGNYPSKATGSRGVVAFGDRQGDLYADTGSAARFFYSPKASRAEREAGLDALGDYRGTTDDGRQTAIDNAYQRGKTERRNVHPTVKPAALIGYLQRLVTPPGGLTIDPYLGSGTAAIAAEREGFRFAGCERETPYAVIAWHRWKHAAQEARAEAEAQQVEAGGQLDLFA